MPETLDLTVRVADVPEVRAIIEATVALLSAVEQSEHRKEFAPQVTLLRSAVTRYHWSRENA